MILLLNVPNLLGFLNLVFEPKKDYQRAMIELGLFKYEKSTY